MEKAPTIYSLARDLNIHPSTVSRAFSRPELVRPELRERILVRAVEVRYRPNAVARGLTTGRTGMIGLLVPDIENPFFPPLVRAVQTSLAEQGQSILLINSDRTADTEVVLIEQVRSRVDGLALVSPRSGPAKLVTAAQGLPLLFVNRGAKGSSSVIIDSGAIADAADQLLAQGHTTFALLRGPHTSWSASRRQHVVEEWAARTGAHLIEFGPYEALFEGGVKAAAAIARSPATAVLAFDDLMAAGTISGLAKAGLRVPDDVSVVGCDDVLIARITAPPLTTVAAPFAELGEAVAAMLGAQLAGNAEPERRVLKGSLVVRGSTGPVRVR